MALTRFNYDWKADMSFAVTFFASSNSEADTTAANLLVKIFGARAAGLFDLTSTSSSALSGQAISGSNYTYNYDMQQGPGSSASSPAVYAGLAAADGPTALTNLKNAASAMLNINPFPIKVNYLHTNP